MVLLTLTSYSPSRLCNRYGRSVSLWCTCNGIDGDILSAYHNGHINNDIVGGKCEKKNWMFSVANGRAEVSGESSSIISVMRHLQMFVVSHASFRCTSK